MMSRRWLSRMVSASSAAARSMCSRPAGGSSCGRRWVISSGWLPPRAAYSRAQAGASPACSRAARADSDGRHDGIVLADGAAGRSRDSESGEVPILSAADTEYHRAMSHLLPLSRVAKLVGQPRQTLQEMIRDGVLATFDGMVELDELLRVFPDVKWDDDAEFRRVQEIKDKAFAKRVLERALPDKDVLVARLN